MLKVRSCAGASGGGRSTDRSSSLPEGALWIDVNDPDAEDVAFIQRETGLTLPDRAALSEVENSSRLRSDDGALYLSLPLVSPHAAKATLLPVGFILTENRLVTIRFHDIPSFSALEKVLDGHRVAHPTAAGSFLSLMEAIVDWLADSLEEIGGRVDHLSDDVFGNADVEPGSRHKKAQDHRLREALKVVGRERQLLSKIRGTLLGVHRILPFVQGEADEWLTEGIKARLAAAIKDVESLDQFDEHLSDKIQFLLDAALGFINVEQNDTFRVLTIVSVVGIPPTLVASMYGMNFKHMPELDWIYGYPYGLALIALSAITPLVYFRSKGWF